MTIAADVSLLRLQPAEPTEQTLSSTLVTLNPANHMEPNQSQPNSDSAANPIAYIGPAGTTHPSQPCPSPVQPFLVKLSHALPIPDRDWANPCSAHNNQRQQSRAQLRRHNSSMAILSTAQRCRPMLGRANRNTAELSRFRLSVFQTTLPELSRICSSWTKPYPY